MKSLRFASLVAAFFVFSSSIFAQTAATDADKEKDQAEKGKKAMAIVESIASDVQLLKLPDNRALVLASTGELMWKSDPKRARQFFRQSADEIIVANSLPKDESQGTLFGFVGNSSPRKQILQTIVKYDSDLALELLYSTRPPDVIAALSAQIPKDPKIVGKDEKQSPASMMEGFQNKALADDEIQLEQSFSSKVAENDPKKAAKLLRESLSKNGVTTSTFDSLRKINLKDNDLAIEVTKEVGQKLLDSEFNNKNGYLQLTVNFLQQFFLGDKSTDKKNEADSKAKPASKTEEKKPIKIEEKFAKDLANKIADSLMKSDSGKNMMAYYQFSPAMPILEKIVPERIALLKQKKDAVKKSMPQEMVFDDEAFSGDNASPDKAIAAANKMPEQIRGFMYKNAVNEAVAKGETDKVREALNNAPAGKDRDNALSFLDSKIAETKIKDGKIDEARAIIDKLSSTKEKVERLVQMAVSFNAKNTKEDGATALKLMDEARGMIDFIPQDEDAINDYLRITGGFASVDPKTAFTMLENFSNQVSDIVTASALLAKYDKRNQSFKKGEMILTKGLPRVGNTVLKFGPELFLLADNDIERLRGIADKFQRDDARILLKLYIVQAFYNKKIGLGESSDSIGVFGEGGGIAISVSN